MDVILCIFAFLLGAVLASFAGVIAYRSPKGLSIVKPDSYCPVCKKGLKWYDNIPILSWLVLGGKCRYCKTKIGVFSLLLEIFGGVSFACAYWVWGRTLENLPVFCLLVCLLFLFLVMAGIDYETHDVYDVTLIIFAALTVITVAYKVLLLKANLLDYIIGGALGFVFFLAVKLIAKVIMKKDALGSGDIYLVGIGGGLVGAIPLLFGLILGTLLGSVIEIIKIKRKKQDRESEIAFAPYLLLGIGAMAIFGEVLMNFYWSVLL